MQGAPPHTLTVDGELDAGLRVGVQAAVVGQAGVQTCVGTAGTGDDVGGPGMHLSVVMEPHVDVYSCHLFLISSASVRSIPFLSFIKPIFA